MQPIVKYALIAGGAGLGVYLLSKRLAASSTTPKPSTISQLVTGFQSLVGAVKGKAASVTGEVGPGTTSHDDINQPAGFGFDLFGVGSQDPATVRAAQIQSAPTPLGPSAFSQYAVWTADGDSAVSDALGSQKFTGTSGQPVQFTRYAQRATIGAIPNASSPYTISASRS